MVHSGNVLKVTGLMCSLQFVCINMSLFDKARRSSGRNWGTNARRT